MASAASTIPGSVATLHSCSSELSPRIASTSSASAKTRAGRRMSERALAGTAQLKSSTRCRSDIEHHRGPPLPSLARFEREAVEGHGLDEVRRAATARDQPAAQARLAELEVARRRRDELVLLGQEDELLEPGGQQRGRVAGLDLERPGDRLVGRLAEDLAECGGRLAHRGLGAGRLDVELQ